MKKVVIVFSLVISVFVYTAVVLASSEHSPAVIEGKVIKAIKIEQKAQADVDSWAEEKNRILTEIQHLKYRSQWLEFQTKKYRGYIAEQQDILRDLTRKKEEIDKIKMNLEPFLERIYQRLQGFVAGDLQFLHEERTGRLEFLRSSLDDYRVKLSEKLRRVLEALQVEANYGRSIGKTEGVLSLGGEKREVNFIRVGRLSLFFISEDHKKAGYLVKETGKWKLLDRKYAKELSKAIEMAERKRAIELVDLPVGKWKNASSAGREAKKQ